MTKMVKAAVAVKLGTATAEAILKRYNSYNVTHPTYKALAEVGKAEKTIYLCDYLPSPEVQRKVHEGLNVVENWNATNDFLEAAQGVHPSLDSWQRYAQVLLLANELVFVD